MQKFQKLSRAEMKNVLGGVLGQAYCSYSGTCTTWDGASGSYDPENGDTGVIVANAFQQAADRWCKANNCCTNADCPGALT